MKCLITVVAVVLCWLLCKAIFFRLINYWPSDDELAQRQRNLARWEWEQKQQQQKTKNELEKN